MAWLEFAAAMLIFMASHRIPALLGVKETLQTILGPRGYTAVFSLVSVVLLLWVIWAAGRAPVISFWDQSPAARWAVNIVMPLAIMLGSYGVGASNPFAFEGRKAGFDPARPGVAGVTRQPLLWALLLWSAAHLWANGDLAHLLLFGVFAVFSGLGMVLVEKRRRRLMGAETWQDLTRNTSLVPFVALIQGRWRPNSLPGWHRFAIGLAVWALLIGGHTWVIGPAPSP